MAACDRFFCTSFFSVHSRRYLRATVERSRCTAPFVGAVQRLCFDAPSLLRQPQYVCCFVRVSSSCSFTHAHCRPQVHWRVESALDELPRRHHATREDARRCAVSVGKRECDGYDARDVGVTIASVRAYLHYLRFFRSLLLASGGGGGGGSSNSGSQSSQQQQQQQGRRAKRIKTRIDMPRSLPGPVASGTDDEQSWYQLARLYVVQ